MPIKSTKIIRLQKYKSNLYAAYKTHLNISKII